MATESTNPLSALPAWIWLALVSIVLALLSFGGWEWHQEREARIKAESAAAAQQANINAARTDAALTATQLKQALDILKAEKARPATPQQIVIDASHLIPNLPQPLTIENTPPKPGTTELPNTPVPQQVVIPAADFKVIQDAMIGCQENAAKLTACNATAVDSATELKAVTAQRDDYKTALKGGTFWRRVRHDALLIGISGGVGYAAGRIQK